MNTLQLNLFRKYFEDIKSGFKKEEYREITPYWANRFLLYDGVKQTQKFWKILFDNWLDNGCEIHDEINNSIQFGIISFKKYSCITFSNGFKKDRPQFKANYTNIRIGPGKSKWGSLRGVTYFVLELEEIITKEK